jgi:hypothetical protein
LLLLLLFEVLILLVGKLCIHSVILRGASHLLHLVAGSRFLLVLIVVEGHFFDLILLFLLIILILVLLLLYVTGQHLIIVLGLVMVRGCVVVAVAGILRLLFLLILRLIAVQLLSVEGGGVVEFVLVVVQAARLDHGHTACALICIVLSSSVVHQDKVRRIQHA